MSMGLSKSRYCKGIQCPKMLWLDKNKPEEAADLFRDSVLANGTRVGDLARSYFGKYELIEYQEDKPAMCEETKRQMEAGTETIAEASFLYDGLYCAVDLFHKNGDGWEIVEVKSSVKVSDIYKEDVAFQYYVLTKCGVNVKKVSLLLVNTDYVRHGELDIQNLFQLTDQTDLCREKFSEVEKNVAAIRQAADTAEEPERDIDTYCENPYECAYKQYCRKKKNVPEQSVFDVGWGFYKNAKYKAYHDGIVSFQDIINKKLRLNEKQQRQVETAYYHKSAAIDREALREFLHTLTYPVYHLDFETLFTPVPRWDGCGPYRQIPFQYSLHIEYEDGTLIHKAFLAKEGTDPRRALAERLCQDIPMQACVLAYNMSFEQGRLKELGECFPDLKEHLLSICDHLHDLAVPFQQQDYYTEAMKGSYSIKAVLPALFPDDPELNYHNLDQVHNGSEASGAFDQMTGLPLEELAKLRENLLKYCELDTYAMVKILRKLRETIKSYGD